MQCDRLHGDVASVRHDGGLDAVPHLAQPRGEQRDVAALHSVDQHAAARLLPPGRCVVAIESTHERRPVCERRKGLHGQHSDRRRASSARLGARALHLLRAQRDRHRRVAERHDDAQTRAAAPQLLQLMQRGACRGVADAIRRRPRLRRRCAHEARRVLLLLLRIRAAQRRRERAAPLRVQVTARPERASDGRPFGRRVPRLLVA